MEFYSNAEYKNAIRCSSEELEILKAKGWTVDIHTESYANFIGVVDGSISMGFYCWIHNLGYGIVGEGTQHEYSETHESEFKIKNQEDLDNFCKMIDLYVKLLA